MTKNTMLDLQASSYLGSDSSAYLEQLYEQYLENPAILEKRWRDYFDSVAKAGSGVPDVPHFPIQQNFEQLAKNNSAISFGSAAQTTSADPEHELKQIKVLELINAYRVRGHQHAKLDPLDLSQRPHVPELALSYYGFTDADMNSVFYTDNLAGKTTATLRTIFDDLTRIYCSAIGFEYMYIINTQEKEWIQKRIESIQSKPKFTVEKKKRIYERLNAAEGLERYLHAKYVGQKRFSLEGGDTMLPMVDDLIQRAGTFYNTRSIAIGMAHRGRLNVLINILGRSPAWLCAQFEGKATDQILGSGDVKYHQGSASEIRTDGGDTHVALASNPSHLEIISPVVEGAVRSRQERDGDEERRSVMPIIMHGDAAFAGQGVVMETFNMSQARGYQTGGTVHIVINNQVGFTTSDPLDSRSTLYCTDVAKMVQAPIFHVNADDPEAALFVTELALDYRMHFKKDVVIDLVCYRRHGHNEADEPAATQPLMYHVIRQKETTRRLYAKKLIAEGIMTEEDEIRISNEYRDALDAQRVVARDIVDTKDALSAQIEEDWKPYFNQQWDQKVPTKVNLNTFKEIAAKIVKVPADFQLQAQVGKMMAERAKMATGEIPADWGFAETMAYATLLLEGYAVRLAGQDSCRGTFAHRHAVLHDQAKDQKYLPLRHLGQNQARFCVIDSMLSEEAVLAFEYGYAAAEPRELVLWEAQFGDFANGAQVVIDQFISSGEQKWGRLSGLTMLLPHGYEGQGPEHSSARLERYLQLCADDNMQVCVPTTPSQIFHLLRRQMIRPYRKPLIVMTPKSLLRHKLAVSTIEEIANGEFQLLIPEIDSINEDNVKRIVFCSGKVYYDLLVKRRDEKKEDVAIVRIEQLYPFPEKEFKAQVARYKNATEIVWCQEEPANQGSWNCCIQYYFTKCLPAGRTLELVSRPAAAAPSVGSFSLHVAQQNALVEQSLR